MVKALTTEERQSIEIFYSAWKEKKPSLLDEVCTPDWQDIPLGKDQVDGPQGLKDIISHFTTILPDIEIIIHEIFGTHERAGVRAAITFTHQHEVLGIPATGKKVTIALHEFHYLKEGKLTHTWHLEDWFSLLMQSSPKTAVITGISSGIGLALAQKLLNENYHVIGTSRSGKMEGLHHPNLHVIPLEATDKDSIQQAISQIPKLTRGIDLLINNAGTAPDVFDINPEINAFNQTLATNVTGVVFFTEPLLPYLKEGAQVVFISSNMGLPRNADSNGPGYRMSKAAVNMYASILAKRVAERGIRVTPMHPGWVQTKLGGSQAPYTPEQAADALYHGITTNVESGKFWNSTINAIEEF